MNLDKIYQEFTEQVAPKIAEGFTLTKDYFFDLFGRYVKYLIIIDSIWLLSGIILATITTTILIKKKDWFFCEEGRRYDRPFGFFIIILCSAFILIPLICINLNNLIKDLKVPEVRVYEEIKDMK